LKRNLDHYTFLAGISGLIILLDQWTKHLVRTNIPYTEAWAPWDWLLPYARIVHWQNTGAAFGMFQGMNLFFSVLAIIVSAAIIYYFPQVPKMDWLVRLALGMQLGGAIGNLIDRIRFGAVTDFVSVGSFAVFNVADASLSVGVVVLILGMWLRERREEKLKQQGAAVSGPEETGSSSSGSGSHE
jgi:signal peptidase II